MHLLEYDEESYAISNHYDSTSPMKEIIDISVKEESDYCELSKRPLPGSPFAMFHSNDESVRHPLNKSLHPLNLNQVRQKS